MHQKDKGVLEATSGRLCLFVIIQHLLKLIKTQDDKLACRTSLVNFRGRSRGGAPLTAHNEEREAF